ncbi:MAG: Lrp/AsnC family transcriptional regulator [Parvibaculales bacterium]
MAKKMKLDKLDHKILATLQAQGKITNVKLAEKVGISAPPCLRRVRVLEKEKLIEGYHAQLNAQKLGFKVSVFAMVSLHSQAEDDLKKFEKLCTQWPQVRECHMLNGEIDFILKCVAPDLEDFQKFLTQKLTPAPNVASVKTSLTIRCSKALPGVPIE